MNIFSVFIVVLTFVGVYGQKCICGIENTELRIIGGRVVEEGKHPWMAFLEIKTEDGESQCGASIINNRYVLTAAHCTASALEITVGIGSIYDSSINKNLLEVEKFFHHPNYDQHSTRNDIALIKLAKPIIFSKKVRPVCLPTAQMSTSGVLTVAGWGLTEHRRTSEVLLETNVEEYPFNKCNKDWGNKLISSQFCAALIGKDSCGGDSGGPLIRRIRGKSYVIGLVSYGVTDCGSARSAVYTKVTSFLEWIKENTNDGDYCSNNI